jgi:predicted NBD/HSP70 family sugar kinase
MKRSSKAPPPVTSSADAQGVRGARAIREVNRTLVLAELARAGQTSRSELARRLGLTKPTISAVVEELTQEGIVHEVGMTEHGAGRPARLLELNENSAAYLGVHLGESQISVGLGNAQALLTGTRVADCDRSPPKRAFETAQSLISELLRAERIPRSRVRAVGVSIPGLVERGGGRCVLAPNLGWRNVDVGAELSERLDLPVVVANTTHAAALAEARHGACRDVRSFVWLYVGNGIGAGLVMDGRLEAGGMGFSGEVGHCAVVPDGEPCGCGRRGCLETVATTGAVVRRIESEVRAGRATALKREKRITVEAICAAADRGDALARDVLAEVGQHLGLGISYLINILSPERIVIGGSRLTSDPFVMEALRSNSQRRSVRGDGIDVVNSSLGDSVHLQGALLLAEARHTPHTRLVRDFGGIHAGA